MRDFNLIQTRVQQTLEKGVQIDLSTQPCKRFLRRHVNQKIPVVVLYVDIDGSTKMSMSLSAPKFASILHIFSQEMSLIVTEYRGYTLKYVGDAVIAIFPAGYDRYQASKNAIACAKDMEKIIDECINPELRAHDLPEISIKISLDYGEVLVVLYGKSLEGSHIDIVGSSISMAAKMLAIAKPGHIIAGHNLYRNLAADLERTHGFANFEIDLLEWSYIDEKSRAGYQLHLVKN